MLALGIVLYLASVLIILILMRTYQKKNQVGIKFDSKYLLFWSYIYFPLYIYKELIPGALRNIIEFSSDKLSEKSNKIIEQQILLEELFKK